jgi:hypothetical protein
MLDVIYSLLVEELSIGAQNAKDRIRVRSEVDAKLNSLVLGRGADGKPDRATWGRLPHQQAAMRAGMTAAG